MKVKETLVLIFLLPLGQCLSFWEVRRETQVRHCEVNNQRPMVLRFSLFRYTSQLQAKVGGRELEPALVAGGPEETKHPSATP